MVTASLMAVFTLAACLPVRSFLARANRVDIPNGRSSHTRPTPRGGGLAFLGATVATVAVLALMSRYWGHDEWVAIGGVVGLAGLGLIDDLTDLDPRLRLLAQAVVGAAVGVLLGGWLGGVLGVVTITAAVNMVNFMDGINGMAAGHAAVWGGGALGAGALAGSDVLTTLGAVSLGGALGFLPWNAPRARLFLGDVGSYFLGGLAGVGVLVGLLAASGSNGDSLKVLALLCAPYLLFAIDTATTMMRRAARGEYLLQAHRDHVYQQLVHNGGWPHWAVSLAAAAVSILVTASFGLSWILGAAATLTASAVYLSSPRLSLKEVAL